MRKQEMQQRSCRGTQTVKNTYDLVLTTVAACEFLFCGHTYTVAHTRQIAPEHCPLSIRLFEYSSNLHICCIFLLGGGGGQNHHRTECLDILVFLPNMSDCRSKKGFTLRFCFSLNCLVP